MNWREWGFFPLDPGQCQWMRLIIRNNNILWFRGGVLNGFWDIKPYMNWMWWGITPVEPRAVSLDVSYHKKQEYIWLRGGDLKVFWDIRPFVKRRGGACPPGGPFVTLKQNFISISIKSPNFRTIHPVVTAKFGRILACSRGISWFQGGITLDYLIV